MLIYCVICWLIGIGIAHEFHKEDKEKGTYKWWHWFGYPLFVFIMPLVLPLGLGAVLGALSKEK